MADLPSSKVKMNDIEVSQDAPTSEALFGKIGSNINALIDEDAALDARVDALEAATDGTAGNFSFTALGTSTLLSYTATMSANDFMTLALAPLASSNFSGTVQVAETVSGTATLQFKRDATVLRTVTGATINLDPIVLFDKPGAGTFTYTLVAAGGFLSVQGQASLVKSKG